MAIPLYLAMTAAEFSACADMPKHMAWMACHFSPYGTGLTNLPPTLPADSLLILNDRTPIHGHDPVKIRDCLEAKVKECSCFGLLLDLQRPVCRESQAIVKELLTLPCPVCVSEQYAHGEACSVFLPPVPPNVSIEEYLAPWQGREIWLDAALTSLCLSVTEDSTLPLHSGDFDSTPLPFADEKLHCHYRIDLQQDSCQVFLQRTKKDHLQLLQDAEAHGVTTAVGLYQELAD